MKILMVSNLYPPHLLGGYEIHCAHVARGLASRGHDVQVLASNYGTVPRQPAISERIDEILVHRRLHQYFLPPQPRRWPWTLVRARDELRDARVMLAVLNEFRPDVVVWWNLHGLPKILLPLPARAGIPDLHAIDDNWMIYEYGPQGQIASAFWNQVWEGNWGPPPLRPLLLRLGRRWKTRTSRAGIPTQLGAHPSCHACFLSEFLLKHHVAAGFAFPSSEIIPGGVQPERLFVPRKPPEPDSREPVRLLFAGQLTRDRGLHTVIEALLALDPHVRDQTVLSVAGGGHESYVAEVKQRVLESGLGERVTFLGKVSPDALPPIYQGHDILVFASTRPEGFGFVAIEAMMAGCAVITTGSGGGMEIALAANLPRFAPNDHLDLAEQLARFVRNRGELGRVARHGQEVACRLYGFDRMIDRWDDALGRLLGPLME